MALGPVMLSGFWALASERFDPREARRRFGQIAAFGTLGSLAGGLMAERVAALSSSADLLILLAVLQLAGSLALFRFAPAQAAEKSHDVPSFPEMISAAPYLVGLAAFVLLVSMSAAGLDFLFQIARCRASSARARRLSRFLAIFYTSISLATFAVQAGLSRIWLKRFGPGRTVAVLPVAVTGASLVSLFAPGAALSFVSRGLEVLLRGSLYRSGYELFYTPMPAAERRSIKAVIDIGADRLGEGLAAAAIQLFLVFPRGFCPLHRWPPSPCGPPWPPGWRSGWIGRTCRCWKKVWHGKPSRLLRKKPKMLSPDPSCCVRLRRSSPAETRSARGRRPSHPSGRCHLATPGRAAIQGPVARAGGAACHRSAGSVLVPQVIELLGRDETARAAHDAPVPGGGPHRGTTRGPLGGSRGKRKSAPAHSPRAGGLQESAGLAGPVPAIARRALRNSPALRPGAREDASGESGIPAAARGGFRNRGERAVRRQEGSRETLPRRRRRMEISS